jgi:hypothetical protein
MALPAYAPEYQAPVERLHYFHPFRAGIAALVIVAADLGMNLLVSGGRSTTLTARLSLLVVLFVFAIGRTFQPRTLRADAGEIRWKKAWQPAQTVPRQDVAAIQYLTTARPGAPRFYFVNRDGSAVLWVDRFTPARMGSFASYLGIPLRPVSAAPPTSASADAAVKASALTGGRQAGMILLGGVAAVALAATVAAGFWVRHEGEVITAYERAPLCQQPAPDPLACRVNIAAVVTAIRDNGRIDLRFSSVLRAFPYPTTWVRIVNGAVPDPGFVVGDSVQIEVFDGRTMAINGATKDAFATLQSNASWSLVDGTGFFLVVSLIGMVAFWKGPSAWIVAPARPATPSKPTLDDPPAVSDQPGPKEKPGAVDRVSLPFDADFGEAWPTLVDVPGFDPASVGADASVSGILRPDERLLARAPVHFYMVPNTSSILLLTDRRLLILGPKRMEIPRARITLLAYWTVRDGIAVTYRTVSGPHGICLTGPQLVLTGGPKTDMHRLFESMKPALTNPDAVREPVVITRPAGRWSRLLQATGQLSHRLWLAWVG